VHITTDLLGKERQILADTSTSKGLKRTMDALVASPSLILSLKNSKICTRSATRKNPWSLPAKPLSDAWTSKKLGVRP
jgi:hypothetical protein